MTQVTAKMVADLRAATGLGMMECKKALVEAEGDFEKAEEILRIKSGAKAGKVAGRIAAEGIIAIFAEGNRMALVEVNCETDFVAKDDNFKAFANDVAAAVVKHNPADLSALSDTQLASGETVEEKRKAVIAKLGENITIRRFKYYETDKQVTSYKHGEKIGVIVEFEGDEPTARDIAMHIAAIKPQCVSKDQVDSSVIEKERHIYTEQVANSGKPPEIIAKMVEGRLKKFLAEITLLEQQFIKNTEQTVQQYLSEHQSKIIGFTVFHVGEGIEKKVVDYAAEVAAVAASV